MENLKDYEIERIVERFNKELEGWSYEDWMSSGAKEREEVVQNVLDDFDFGWVMEEELYEVFEDWCQGIDETYFRD